MTAMRSGVDAKLGGVGGQPDQPGIGVLNRGEIRVLGCEPVLDRQHRDAGVGDVANTEPSKIGTEPRIMPPPWRYSTAAELSLEGKRYQRARMVVPSATTSSWSVVSTSSAIG